MIPFHNASLERIRAFGIDCSIAKPRNQEAYSILVGPINAFDIGTILSLVPLENCATKIDYFQFMLVTVSMQESRQLFADEEKFFHFSRLRHKLLSWELVSFESEV